MRAMLVILVLFAAACSNDAPGCYGSVSSYSVSGTTLTVEGEFSGGQPILELTVGGQKHDIPAGDQDLVSATFDLSGIPAGTYEATWLFSCDENGSQMNISGPTAVGWQ